MAGECRSGGALRRRRGGERHRLGGRAAVVPAGVAAPASQPIDEILLVATGGPGSVVVIGSVVSSPVPGARVGVRYAMVHAPGPMTAPPAPAKPLTLFRRRAAEVDPSGPSIVTRSYFDVQWVSPPLDAAESVRRSGRRSGVAATPAAHGGVRGAASRRRPFGAGADPAFHRGHPAADAGRLAAAPGYGDTAFGRRRPARPAGRLPAPRGRFPAVRPARPVQRLERPARRRAHRRSARAAAAHRRRGADDVRQQPGRRRRTRRPGQPDGLGWRDAQRRRRLVGQQPAQLPRRAHGPADRDHGGRVARGAGRERPRRSDPDRPGVHAHHSGAGPGAGRQLRDHESAADRARARRPGRVTHPDRDPGPTGRRSPSGSRCGPAWSIRPPTFVRPGWWPPCRAAAARAWWPTRGRSSASRPISSAG